jgi:hypothetical protein
MASCPHCWNKNEGLAYAHLPHALSCPELALVPTDTMGRPVDSEGCHVLPNGECVSSGPCAHTHTVTTKDTNPKDAIGATKAPLSLVPDTARVAMAMGFLEGATKYGRYNWRAAGVRASIYMDAAQRHLAKWWNGEDIDPDSGLPHLAKAMCCLAVLVDAAECDKLSDDRPPRAPVAEMIDRATPLVGEIKARYAHLSPHQYTIADGAE